MSNPRSSRRSLRRAAGGTDRPRRPAPCRSRRSALSGPSGPGRAAGRSWRRCPWCSPIGTCSGTTRIPYASRSCPKTCSKSAFSRSSRLTTTTRGVLWSSSSDHTAACRPGLRRGVDDHDRGVGNAPAQRVGHRRSRGIRSVEEIDLGPVMSERGERDVDRDAALLLFRIGIEDAGRVIDLAEAVRAPTAWSMLSTRVVFPRSAVPHDRHIAVSSRVV